MIGGKSQREACCRKEQSCSCCEMEVTELHCGSLSNRLPWINVRSTALDAAFRRRLTSVGVRSTALNSRTG